MLELNQGPVATALRIASDPIEGLAMAVLLQAVHDVRSGHMRHRTSAREWLTGGAGVQLASLLGVDPDAFREHLVEWT